MEGFPFIAKASIFLVIQTVASSSENTGPGQDVGEDLRSVQRFNTNNS
jgi:hypothetical protein